VSTKSGKPNLLSILGFVIPSIIPCPKWTARCVTITTNNTCSNRRTHMSDNAFAFTEVD
jgi:hypothetical protein